MEGGGGGGGGRLSNCEPPLDNNMRKRQLFYFILFYFILFDLIWFWFSLRFYFDLFCDFMLRFYVTISFYFICFVFYFIMGSHHSGSPTRSGYGAGRGGGEGFKERDAIDNPPSRCRGILGADKYTPSAYSSAWVLFAFRIRLCMPG
jgi:hypothetical protein